MRPHKLTMKGFGPFAKETVIDFDRLGNSIFLISGETGSGKTMIFDALVYALYGTTSGERRDKLSIASYLSDFGSEEEKNALKVELTFSEGGKNYTVERRLERKRKNLSQSGWLKRDGELLVENKSRFVETDKLIYGRTPAADDVTQKVGEIVNLNADQFRRIVLLAQGEFQRFLTATAEERGKILGKLYDNRRHKDLEARLSDAHNKLRRQINERTASMAQYLKGCQLPENIEGGLNLDISTPQECIEKLKAINTADEAAGEKAEENRSQLLDKQKEIAGERVKAENGNNIIDKRDRAVGEKKKLEEQQTAMDGLAAQLDWSEKALRVRPAEEARNKAAGAKEKAEGELNGIKQEKENLDHQKVSMKEKEDKQEGRRNEATALATVISNLKTNILPLYGKIAFQTIAEEKAKGELREIDGKEQELKKKKKENEQEKTENGKTLEQLRNEGEAAVAIAKQKVDDLKERGKKLRELKGGKDGKKGLGKKRALDEQIADLEEKYTKAVQKHADALKNHQKIKKAFLSGQAVLLANDLRDEIAKSGQAVCPVCGQHHTAATIADKAVATGQVPTEAEVNEAEQNANAACNEANTQKTELEKTKAAAKAVDDSLREKAAELGLTVEEKTGLPTLEETEKAFNQCCADYKKAEADLKEAEAKKTKKETAEKKARELEEGKKHIDQEAESLQEKKGAANKALTAATTALEGYRKTLQDNNYPADELAAKRELKKKEAEAKRLADEINGVEKEITAYHKAVNTIDGRISTAEGNLTTREAELTAAQKKYEDALKEYGFDGPDGEAAYKDALSPAGKSATQKLESWLKDGQRKLEEYRTEQSKLETTIDNLQKEIEGKKLQYQELTEFDEKADKLKEKIGALDKEFKTITKRLAINKKAARSFEEAAEEREQAGRSLDALAPLVSGVNEIEFHKYVLQDFFQKIIFQANGYFRTMIGGQYEIIAADEGNTGGKDLSLGLQYRNIIAEKIHDCASLSGGQSFEASLALALGLSDVVQLENSTAVNIDSMYIDEGFGTLSREDLNNAIKVLGSIAEGDRQIGIISHVEELEKTLSNKIIVTKTENGSTIELQTDLRA